MSDEESSTASEDENDDTSVSTADSDDEAQENSTQVDLTHTSDGFLTLQDEPNDLLLSRPPADGQIDGQNDDDEEADGEVEVHEVPINTTNTMIGTDAAQRASQPHTCTDSREFECGSADATITAFKTDSVAPLSATPLSNLNRTPSKMKAIPIVMATQAVLTCQRRIVAGTPAIKNEASSTNSKLDAQSAEDAQPAVTLQSACAGEMERVVAPAVPVSTMEEGLKKTVVVKKRRK